MRYANSTSPFMTSIEGDPWLVWDKSDFLSELQPRDDTDRQLVDEHQIPTHGRYSDYANVHPATPPVTFPGISRNQYNAVMERMKNASGHAGGYSAWSS